jgi:hypothetical protein
VKKLKLEKIDWHNADGFFFKKDKIHGSGYTDFFVVRHEGAENARLKKIKYRKNQRARLT